MGRTFQTPGTGGSMDKRNVATLRVPYYCADFADVFTVGKEPPSPGLIAGERSWKDNEAGGYDVSVSYEGVPDGLAEDKETFEFDPSFGEEPLPAHAEWEAIKKFYVGSVDKDMKVSFAEYLESGKGGTALTGLSDFRDKGRKNPLYGAKTYLALKAVFRWTYVRKNLPQDFLSRIGTIRKALPAGLPTPANHDWLVMPPKATVRGNVNEIREEWLLSTKGGWPKEVYRLIET